MLSNKVRAALTAGYTVLSIASGALGYEFQHTLQPTLPLIPLACGAMAFICAGAAGYLFSGFGE